MSGTKRFVEQRIMKNRMQEAKDTELRRMLVENNILAGHGKSEHRVEEKRRARSCAAERRDLFMDYTYTKGEQEKEKRTRMTMFEENLADELARRKADSLRQEMNKRRICDGSEELRALKERLHAAKVNKERAQQLLEGEVRKEMGFLKEKKISEHMENERLEHMELEHKLNLEKMKQRERVKVINQQQIASKEAQRQEALMEYLKEKDQVDELVNKIAQEDADETRAREEQKAAAKEVMRQFMIEQKQKQEQAEQAEREEAERIEAFAQAKRDQEARLAAEAEEVEREKQRILNKMLGKAEALNKEKEELEQLRNDLHLEQAEAANRRRDEVQMRKRLEDKEEMKNAYLSQMKMKEEKAQKAYEEDQRIKEALMAKFAEDDRIEQMSEQKRRMKVEQHKREANRLVELRQQMYEVSRADERANEERLRAEESDRQVIIEEERRRLLAEHAPGLRDFLPKHTLETREDYEFLFADRLGSGGLGRSASATNLVPVRG
mmetsp:Transcript_76074/g.211483  ORF Transcript_76074/g.211483 Transcript_76074/m.211483 type:complete len:496 (-) Transcript_76074:210-1697(-)